MVLIPAYQAESSIQEVVRGFASKAHRVIVVDDASRDATAARVQELGLDNVSVVRHPVNRGVGGAVKTGIREALKGGAHVVVKADADGQMSPLDLDALLEPILTAQADASKGNRWYDRRALLSMPRLRRWGNLGLSFMLRLASGNFQVFDPTNGYVAWRADLLKRLDLESLPERFTFESAMLIEIGMLKGLVRDVPIAARYGGESSHLKVSRALIAFPPFLLRATLRRFWRMYFVTDFNAVSLLVLVGFFLNAFAAIFGGHSWWESIRTGVPATAGTVILAALPLMFGFNCWLQALVLDIGFSPSQRICRGELCLRDGESGSA